MVRLHECLGKLLKPGDTASVQNTAIYLYKCNYDITVTII